LSDEGVSARDDTSQRKLELTVVPLGRGEDQEIRRSENQWISWMQGVSGLV
jgi:hypothetical protein